jgi:hypothetical protein
MERIEYKWKIIQYKWKIIQYKWTIIKYKWKKSNIATFDMPWFWKLHIQV